MLEKIGSPSRCGPAWKDGPGCSSARSMPRCPELRAQLETKRQAIVGGKLQPFAGRFGQRRPRAPARRCSMDDAAISTMNWLAAGVVGTLP